MTKGYWERIQLLAVIFSFSSCLIFGLSVDRGQAQAPAAKGQEGKNPLLPTGPEDSYTAFADCRGCHNEKAPIDVKDNEFASRYKSNEFVLLTEGRTWKQKDPHSAAFEVLERLLGKQMSKILGYEVTKSAQCLTCHSVDKHPEISLPTTEQEVVKRFDREDGITCNACHGIRKAWQTEHKEVTTDGKRTIPWRTMTPEYKENKGMRNLRDPVVKAQLCSSCHVGNASQGKVVTHEMYAAGHPPLPPFELATFMECQPQHWGYPTNPALKFFTDAGFKEYAGDKFAADHPKWKWELYRFHPEEEEVLAARPLVAGAIASLSAEMRMISQDATQVTKGHESGMDFARFDCFACHHDLKYPSDRQKRGYAGAPGRPPIKAWIAALPSVIAEHATGLSEFPEIANLAKEFRPKWEAVQKASLAKPFGEPASLTRAAADLNAWCDGFLKQLQMEAKPLYTKQQEERLLAAIGKAASSGQWTADPEATMHLTWAYVTLCKQTAKNIPQDKLSALNLTIPTQVRGEPFSTDMGPTTVGDTLAKRLDVFRQYDPARFSKAFGDILGATSRPK